jgi:hypothetical protein
LTSSTTNSVTATSHTHALSNVDAVTVNGNAATTASTGDTVVVRNSAGDIVTRLFRSEYASTNPTINYFATQVALGVGADNYLRPSTTAQVATALLAEGQIGYRNVPLTTTNANYTFVAGDAGKGRLHTSATAHIYTIPAVFAVGDVLSIINTGTGGLTLTAGAGVDLYLAPGSAAAGDRTLSQRGVATVLFTTATSALVFGVGVS